MLNRIFVRDAEPAATEEIRFREAGFLRALVEILDEWLGICVGLLPIAREVHVDVEDLSHEGLLSGSG
jgi:hypothetical protein